MENRPCQHLVWNVCCCVLCVCVCVNKDRYTEYKNLQLPNVRKLFSSVRIKTLLYVLHDLHGPRCSCALFSFLGCLQKSIEYKGLQFPSSIECPHAVAQVLNQEPGKLKVKDLRDSE